MNRADGTEVSDNDMLVVTTTDFVATGGDDILTLIMPEDGFATADNAPLVRDAIAGWMRSRGGTLNADSFSDPENPEWNLPNPLPADCAIKEMPRE